MAYCLPKTPSHKSITLGVRLQHLNQGAQTFSPQWGAVTDRESQLNHGPQIFSPQRGAVTDRESQLGEAKGSWHPGRGRAQKSLSPLCCRSMEGGGISTQLSDAPRTY